MKKASDFADGFAACELNNVLLASRSFKDEPDLENEVKREKKFMAKFWRIILTHQPILNYLWN
jgi:hypothetical protein